MKKIAYIARNLNVNGISSVILNYCEKLDKEKFEISIFAGKPINSINIERCKKNNIKIIETPKKRGKNPLKYYIFLFKKLKDFDIVHVHGNSRTILLELLISKFNKNKFNIAHCHSTTCDNKFFHFLFTPFFKKSYDIGLACSNDAGRWMFGKNNFFILPNGFDTKKFIFDSNLRNEIRTKLNLHGRFVIGHTGNFSEPKNYPFIIEVFDEICKFRNDVALLLIGNNNNDKYLKEKILNSKNSDKIILYGTTSEIYKVYNAMDSFLFPSKYEGLGIVLLEAQCNGLKCITSTAVPRDVKIDDRLIEFLDLNCKKSEWINSIFNNNEITDRKKLFFKNKKKIDEYNIDNCILKLQDIYEKGVSNENN